MNAGLDLLLKPIWRRAYPKWSKQPSCQLPTSVPCLLHYWETSQNSGVFVWECPLRVCIAQPSSRVHASRTAKEPVQKCRQRHSLPLHSLAPKRSLGAKIPLHHDLGTERPGAVFPDTMKLAGMLDLTILAGIQTIHK